MLLHVLHDEYYDLAKAVYDALSKDGDCTTRMTPAHLGKRARDSKTHLAATSEVKIVHILELAEIHQHGSYGGVTHCW